MVQISSQNSAGEMVFYGWVPGTNLPAPTSKSTLVKQKIKHVQKVSETKMEFPSYTCNGVNTFFFSRYYHMSLYDYTQFVIAYL